MDNEIVACVMLSVYAGLILVMAEILGDIETWVLTTFFIFVLYIISKGGDNDVCLV